MKICEAARKLHSLGIVHRDIKPENIILNPISGKIKLVDFGFATNLNSSNHVYPHCGTPGFAAPELLDKTIICITPQADVFSIGVTLYFMLFGELPYPKKIKSLVLANKKCQFQFNKVLASHQKLQNFMERTICFLKSRFTVEELLTHPYLNQKN